MYVAESARKFLGRSDPKCLQKIKATFKKTQRKTKKRLVSDQPKKRKPSYRLYREDSSIYCDDFGLARSTEGIKENVDNSTSSR